MVWKEGCDMSIRTNSEKCYIKKWYFWFIFRCLYDISWSDKLRCLQYSHITEWSDKFFYDMHIISILISSWQTSLIYESESQLQKIHPSPSFWMREDVLIPRVERCASREANMYIHTELHHVSEMPREPCCDIFVGMRDFHTDYLLAFTQKIKKIIPWRKKHTPLSIPSHSLPYLRSHSGHNSHSRWNTLSGHLYSICWLSHFGSTLLGNRTKMPDK